MEDSSNTINIAYEGGVTPEFALYVKGLLDDARPKKVSHAAGYFKADFSGQYNLRNLDGIVNDAFDDYALDPEFLRLAEQSRKSFAPGAHENQIATAMAELKRVYFDKVVKYYITREEMLKGHMTPLTSILSTKYDANEFLRRVELLTKNLFLTGQTTLPREEGMHIPVYDERERMKADRLMAFKQLFDADAEKARQKRERELELRARRLELEQRITEINPFNQNSKIYAREFPDIQTWMRNPESARYVPRIMVSVSDYINQVILPETGDMLRGNLRTVFRNPQHNQYLEFVQQFDEMAVSDTAKITEIIAGGASIRKDKVAEFDVAEMTHSVVPWVAAYYRLNEKAVGAISDLRKKHVASLVASITDTYKDMLQSDERIVA